MKKESPDRSQERIEWATQSAKITNNAILSPAESLRSLLRNELHEVFISMMMQPFSLRFLLFWHLQLQ